VISTGVSRGFRASWNATTGGTTPDSSVLWYNGGAFTANSLAWAKGMGYVFSFQSPRQRSIHCHLRPQKAWRAQPTSSGSPVAPWESPKGLRHGRFDSLTAVTMHGLVTEAGSVLPWTASEAPIRKSND